MTSWIKARQSAHNGACVEVRATPEGVEVRDSKDQAGPVLRYTPTEWVCFLHGVKACEFDHLTP